MAVKLGALLVREGVITPAQLEDGMRIQKIYGGRLGRSLVELGFIEGDVLSEWLGRIFGFPPATTAMLEECPAELLRIIPADMAEKYECYPLKRDGRRLLIAMANPSDLAAADVLTFKTGLRIVQHAVAEAVLYDFLEKSYGVDQKLQYVKLSTRGAVSTVPPSIKRKAPAPVAATPDLMPETDGDPTQGWQTPGSNEASTLPGAPSLPPGYASPASISMGPPGPASMAGLPRLAPASYLASTFRPEAGMNEQAAAILAAAHAALTALTGPSYGGPASAPSYVTPAAANPWAAYRQPISPISAGAGLPRIASQPPPPLPPSPYPVWPPPPAGVPAPPASSSWAPPTPTPVAATPVAPGPDWLRPSDPPPVAPPTVSSPPPLSPQPPPADPPTHVAAPPASASTDAAPAEPESVALWMEPAHDSASAGSTSLTQAQAVAALAATKSREEVAEIILAFAGVVFDNALIFFVHEGFAVGWKGRGAAFAALPVERVKVPLSVPSFFQEAAGRLRAAGGVVADTAFNRQLYKTMRCPPAKSAAIVPIAVGSRVVNLIYVDRTGRTDALEASAALSELAVTVSEAYARILTDPQAR